MSAPISVILIPHRTSRGGIESTPAHRVWKAMQKILSDHDAMRVELDAARARLTFTPLDEETPPCPPAA